MRPVKSILKGLFPVSTQTVGLRLHHSNTSKAAFRCTVQSTQGHLRYLAYGGRWLGSVRRPMRKQRSVYFPVMIWDLVSCISVVWPFKTSGLSSPQGLAEDLCCSYKF